MDRPLDPLTGRELEILQLLADGLSDQEVSERLFLTTGTVKWHIKNIYSKLGVHKRTAAVAQARAFMLLRLEDEPRHTVQKHNLPHPTSSFVGRETDTANVLSMLSDPSCRLVTLVGIGGIGKTRLAIHCAGQLIDAFSDGVCFINLDSVSTQALPFAIADALEIRSRDAVNLTLQVIHSLRYRRQLLVLDSFEHFVSQSGFLAEVSAAAPGIKILVTSREVLNLTGEWVYALEGLTVPDASNAHDLIAFGSSHLFVERALRTRGDFSAITERLWIARICQLVGGMPLAIELLTSWLRVLTCQEICQELERNHDLTGASRRDLPERHQSMRAVFDHSWRLLTAEERTALMKMAVFHGGFTREAAETVAGATLHILMSLVNQSVILVTKQHRYDLHILLCHYCEQKLQEHPDAAVETRRRHSHYYADIVLNTEPAIAQLDIENVWASMGYAVQLQDREAIIKLAVGLWGYFEARGWYLVAERVLTLYQESIALFENDPGATTSVSGGHSALRYLYESLANFLHAARQYEEARSAYQAALGYVPRSERTVPARLQRKIGATYAAERKTVEPMFAAYQAAHAALGDPPETPEQDWWQEWIQVHLDVTWAYYTSNNIDGMMREIEIVESAVNSFGTSLLRSKLLNNRMLIDLRRYKFHMLPDETLRCGIEALEAAREGGDLRECAWLQFNVGFVHLWRDELDEAESHFLQSLELARQVGDTMGTYTTALAYLPLIYRRRQQVDMVEHWATQGLDAARYANAPMYLGVALAHVGWVLYRRGNAREAASQWQSALNEWQRLPLNYPMQWLANLPLMALALEANYPEPAIDHARKILTLEHQLLAPMPTLLSEAVHLWDSGQHGEALDCLHEVCRQALPLGYL